MSSLSIGLSGLQVNQRLLDLAGQNITNANTPGYHNQVADLAEITDGSQIGAGVQITSISRNTDQPLQQAVNDSASASSSSSTQLASLNQLQTYLATGSGTLHDSLVSLFSDLETLTANPGDATQRAVVVSDANDVANQLNNTMANLNQMSGNLVQQAQSYTDNVNGLTSQIAQLNQRIQLATAAKQDANSLLDARDQAIANLSQIIGVQTVQQSGETSVFVNGTALVLGSQATSISTTLDNEGNLTVTAAGAQQPLDVSGGNLGGIVSLVNSTLPAVESQLNTFTQALTTQFDEIQATGLGANGPMTSVTSQRAVDNVNQPLAVAGLSNPPQAGTLYVTVTNQATGQQTVSQVAIDPATQSLTDVASAIGTIANMNAVVDPQNGEMTVFAAPGYAFAFTGNGTTGNADSGNLLSALGLNSFFVGNSAADLQVSPSLLSNPSQLAVSATGQSGDNGNLMKFVNLQGQPVLNNGTQSMLQYLENIIGNVGTQASEMQTSGAANSSLNQQLTTQLQNATGVDTNDALMQLVQYQQAYQMSAQFVSVVNQAMNDFFNIVLPT